MREGALFNVCVHNKQPVHNANPRSSEYERSPQSYLGKTQGKLQKSKLKIKILRPENQFQIQSYTRIASNDSDEILVASNEPKILDPSSPPSFLDEQNCNYHEITAIGEQPAAFFDVLTPPYSDFNDESPDSRHCHFYRKLMVDNEKKILRLEKIPCPSHYYCDQLEFDKPDYMT